MQDNDYRAGPSSAVVVDGHVYLFDAGEGCSRQLMRTGYGPDSVDAVFVTHHHFDHNCDLGHVLAYAWFAGRAEPVGVYGPRPTAAWVDKFLELQSYDITVRVTEEGKEPLRDHVTVTELPRMDTNDVEGVVAFRDERVTVRAARVVHGSLDAVAYRISTPDGDLVFSGDRGGSDRLEDFAADCDVLIHEVIDKDLTDRVFAARDVPKATRNHLMKDHCSPEQVAEVATAARSKLLILHHYVPSRTDLISNCEWTSFVSKHTRVAVVAGDDLMSFRPGGSVGTWEVCGRSD